MNAPSGIVNIRGKEYQTVAFRIHQFREEHPTHSLTTSIVSRDADEVVMLASISDPDGRVIATGHAEEKRSASQINKTSALENAETSAIGRALAAFGLGGTEYASADEVANAIAQQREGQGQGDSQGKVSPPAKPAGWREPDSAYNCKTALHKGLTTHQSELRRIGDEGVFDDLDGYLTSPEYQEFVKIAGKHAPHYLEGGPPAPDEFVGTFALEQRARDLIALRGNNPAEKETA